LGVTLVTSRSRSQVRLRRVGLGAIALAGVVCSAAPASAAATPSLPDAPTITSAVAGVQNATISFHKPSSDGGLHVFAYRVTCTSTDGVFTFTGNGAHTPLRVGHLSVRKVYTCRVAARNGLGLGAFSAESAPVIPQVDKHRSVPAPPTTIAASGGAGFATVVFGGGAYSVFGNTTMYRAVCTSSNGGHPGSERNKHPGPIAVRGLTVGKTYTCYGQSRDQFGWSAASPHSNAFIVLDQPSGPASPVVTSVIPGLRTVTVTFTRPKPGAGGRLYPYRATCISSDGGVTQTRAGKGSPIAVTGLSLAKTYTCTATAHDHLGWGTPSQPSEPVVTLPAT
jgi:large repetitive protein